MSYAIVRNEKLTRAEINGKATHNDRKAKNHTNKDIDPTKTHLNYYIKKNELTYTKEFDKYMKENDLQCYLRSNSIVMCQMIFTSDQEFFDRIGEEETKRYFGECYKFICNYKNLGEKNIISAVVHLDEGAPHMHLMFVPVVHTKDKDGKKVDKICARDFWKGRDSYRKLQDAYFNHVKSKGFDLERGMFVEDTGRKHYTVEEYKKITNYENTKKILKNITLDIPETPNIKDIKKVMLGRDEKIENEIIKPRDKLIQELYQENVSLHKELSKQSNTVDFATEYEKKHTKLLEDNVNLKFKCQNLEKTLEGREKEFQQKIEDETYKIDYQYHKIINKLEKENNYLKKVIDSLKMTVHKFITWVCHKFSAPSEDNLIRDFEKETYISFNLEKQVDTDKFEIELEQEDDELELY